MVRELAPMIGHFSVYSFGSGVDSCAVVQRKPSRCGQTHRSKARKNQYRMNAQCLPAEGTDAALNLQDFGTSHWQLAD
jgi:hypothetical protein